MTVIRLFVILSVYRRYDDSRIYVVSGSDGTTDVTRTVHFGTPSAFEKVRLLKLLSAPQSEGHSSVVSSRSVLPTS